MSTTKTPPRSMTSRFLRPEDEEAIERVHTVVRKAAFFKPMSPDKEAKILALRRSVTSIKI